MIYRFDNDHVNDRIGYLVGMFRRSFGLSRDELGEQLGIRAQQLGKLERGESNWTVTQLLVTAHVFKVSPSTFIDFFLAEEETDHHKAVLQILLDSMNRKDLDHLKTVSRILHDMSEDE